MPVQPFEYTKDWTNPEDFPLLSFSKDWTNPEDFPTIETSEIKVREDQQFLYNEIKDYLNNKLIPAVVTDEATEAARAEAESARETNEEMRQTKESERQAAEEARAQAEEQRGAAEDLRQSAEESRAQSERGRAAQESGRQTAETNRNTAEEQRTAAETQRARAEIGRQSEEQSRVQAEEQRVSQESDRQAAEEVRAQTEQNRMTAETQRQSAETQRRANEEARSVWEPYDSARAYIPGNKVAYQGASYVNRAACTGVPPTDAAHWLKIADAGRGIQSITKTSGTGAPGTTDTYTITYTDATISTYQVYNGRDGEGAGDMLTSVYDPTGKNTDVFGYVDKKIGAIPTPDVSKQIERHDQSLEAHADIREAVQAVEDSLEEKIGDIERVLESVVGAV